MSVTGYKHKFVTLVTHRLGFLYNLNNKDEHTTETEDNAMAADPIQGCNLKPKGARAPAAMGMPKML